MNRLLRSLGLAVSLVAAAGVFAYAHGGHDHVMGTVKAVDAKARTVEVETRDGKRVTVQLDDKTKYLRGSAEAKAADVVAGVRVVIEAAAVDGKQVAREIRLGSASK